MMEKRIGYIIVGKKTISRELISKKIEGDVIIASPSLCLC